MCPERATARGYALVEMLIAMTLGALVFAGVARLVGSSFALTDQARARNEVAEAGRFALERMTRSVRATGRLILPRPDDPGTVQDESDRDPGVLAVTLDPAIDRDRDGVFDADNDGDGRFDEDPGGDVNFDLAPGIFGIDDDADGTVDEQHTQGSGPTNEDDDEDDFANENGWSGADDDGDGWRDEDPKKDMNGDALPGIGGVDDDGDSTVDEGDKNDDDEDGSVDEDWFDTAVFYLSGTTLVERVPVPWDANGDSSVNGRDFIERSIALDVVQFRVRRLEAADGGAPLVEVTLTLGADAGDDLTLTALARAGGGP